MSTKLNIVFNANTATILYNNFSEGTGKYKAKRVISKSSIKDVTLMRDSLTIAVCYTDGTADSFEYTWFEGYNSAEELMDAFITALNT